MFKPSYSVVTCVLLFFAVLAFTRHAFIGLIPRVNNKLAFSRQKFLASAGHQEIVWHLLDDNAFEQAKHGDKPILLVIGLSASRLGMDFDKKAFEEPDTARFVSQNFFCIRIDGFEHPEWLNALLPVSRMRVGLLPAFQAYTMDPEGHVLSLIGRTFERNDMDARYLYRSLLEARDQYEAIRARRANHEAGLDLQTDDLITMASHTGMGRPSLSAYAEVLGTLCDSRFGGFPESKLQRLHPNAWEFLTLCGYNNLWNASMNPILVSKLVDIQDGGFFRIGFGRDVTEVEMGKGTRENAEMMYALALQGQVGDDPFSVRMSESTFDWLLQTATLNGILPACQDDDETPQGRSPRLSFPTWRLHDALDAEDRDWAFDMLGLTPAKNRQMIPYLTSRATITDNETTYNRVIGLLRANTTTKPQFNDSGYLDVNAHSIARMLEVARIWDDQARVTAMQPLIRELKGFHNDKELLHGLGDKGVTHGYLGDYLALSDELLQEYLTTGQAKSLDEGLEILHRALWLFKGQHPWQLNLARDVDDMEGFSNFCVPEIADNNAESCTAQAIRLEWAYGRLTADTPNGQALLRLARQTTNSYSDLAGHGGVETAGYFCAAADVMDGRYAIAVGPNARQMADALYRQIPTRFIAPALGSARRDLQHRRPGIYVIGNGIQGPMSVDDAADLLPVALSPRQTP